MHNFRITIVTENTARRPDVIAEHGLAYWIETPNGRILFDTGREASLRHNAQALKMNLQQTDAIVLSHGHYDHTGGLAYALQQAPAARLFLHRNAMKPRFSIKGDLVHEIGMPEHVGAAVKNHPGRKIWTRQPLQVAEGIFVTGPISRINTFEDTGGNFFLDERGKRVDGIHDDQALWLETPKGLVVLLGCAHAGVINTLDYIRKLTVNQPLRAVIGGMHLHNAAKQRLQRTVTRLKRLAPDKIAPIHCTGLKAAGTICAAFPKACLDCGAGTVLEF